MLLTPFFLRFFWKKKYLYTVIDYHDGIDNQSVVLDLHRAVEKAQAIIYLPENAIKQEGYGTEQRC